LAPAPAGAFPGLFAGKNSTPRYSNSTHVVVFKKGNVTAVTVMPDYQGPLDGFAWVMPVPADVKLDTVRTLRRDLVDHIDQISAPRFAEFWEMDPCEPGPAEQDWERNLKVDGPGFLDTGGLPTGEGSKKVPKELLIPLDPEFRDSTYKLSLIPAGTDVAGWLKARGTNCRRRPRRKPRATPANSSWRWKWTPKRSKSWAWIAPCFRRCASSPAVT
jgi:hypothetical protein